MKLNFDVLNTKYGNIFIIAFIIIIAIIYIKEKSTLKKKTDNKNSKKIASNSEYRIAEYLDKLKIPYKTQYTFKGCKDKKMLPFDFAILNKKGSVILIIEYDGEQHFHPVRFNGQTKKQSNKNFKICKKHDKIKNSFCKKRKIPLLRISYTENNKMYKIIRNKLVELNIIQ